LEMTSDSRNKYLGLHMWLLIRRKKKAQTWK
jgi:hypothetical protein